MKATAARRALGGLWCGPWGVSPMGGLTCPHGARTAVGTEGCAEGCPPYPEGYAEAYAAVREAEVRADSHRAKRRADYYIHGHPRWGAYSGPWSDLNDDEARAVALSRMGHSKGGVAEVLDVSVHTAGKYLRRAADAIGAPALEVAHPDLLDRWPYAPVPWAGPADVASRRWRESYDDTHTPQQWTIRDDGVAVCPHDNEHDAAATMGARRTALRKAGVRIGTAAKRGCTCLHPLIQAGKW